MFKTRHRFSMLGDSFFSYCQPTLLTNNPRLIHQNHNLFKQLGINLSPDDSYDLTNLLAGNTTILDYPPLASVYMGHQFGEPVYQLGDGRALLVAEHLAPNGEIWELQLKGAGKTPYSRFADGRAVLRSTIREYLGSHAMANLGIPTTEALAILHSEDKVMREQVEPAAVLLRAAPSFLRFGHFEYFAAHSKFIELEQLIQFTLQNYFPQINPDSTKAIPELLDKIVELTAKMIAKWQSVGFVHGVMNSDNMSILGLTIDYGPYSFMDNFAPTQIYNHSDSDGRYVYAAQAQIGWWYLYRLADAFAKIYPTTEDLEEVLAKYPEYFNQSYQQIMGKKLGLVKFNAEEMPLLDELLEIMYFEKIDWTYFWRQLSFGECGYAKLQHHYPSLALQHWLAKLAGLHTAQSLGQNERLQLMQANNPAIILRNYFLDKIIFDAHKGNYAELALLFTALANPYQELAEFAHYYQLPPANLAPCSLSCSS